MLRSLLNLINRKKSGVVPGPPGRESNGSAPPTKPGHERQKYLTAQTWCMNGRAAETSTGRDIYWLPIEKA